MKSLILILVFMSTTIYGQTFKDSQKKYQRVKTAYQEKEQYLKTYARAQLNTESLANSILIIAYKKEEILEVWSKPEHADRYQLFVSYPFCSSSGVLGPKRVMGDGQIPEGFYYINRFNPVSTFYLSLGLNYPNKSDRILAGKNNPGGDIFIHGSCATIGCIPITDVKIMELYVLAVEAKNSGQSDIPVYIFPTKLDDANYDILKEQYSQQIENIRFWDNIKKGYDKFIETKQLLDFTIDKTGLYIIK